MKKVVYGESCNSTFVIILGMMIVLIYKVSNKIQSSRCTQIKCGCVKFTRLPLRDTKAVELASSNV